VIYDCFIFFDEIELLELRLQILGGVVDRFVVVESDVTFQGEAKALHYLANAHGYAQWADKIVHVAVTDMPDCETAWDRERYQRRAIMRGLDGAADDDLVVIADVDEIPRPEILLRLADELVTPVALRMSMYYYFANLMVRPTWDLPKAARRRDLHDAEELRTARGLPIVEGAGWHFSYFMDREGIRRKLSSFSHVEYANDRYMSPIHIDRSLKLGVGLFGGGSTKIVPPTDLPAVLTNDKRYAKYFHPGRTRFEALLAPAYKLTTSCRSVLPNWLTDSHPVLAFFVATPIVVIRPVRRKLSVAYRKARSVLGRIRSLALRV
jgi:beta-1,4-mannosyl-glycoprotein beta-1,4-N-acetylglucosaminyltransferase